MHFFGFRWARERSLPGSLPRPSAPRYGDSPRVQCVDTVTSFRSQVWLGSMLDCVVAPVQPERPEGLRHQPGPDGPRPLHARDLALSRIAGVTPQPARPRHAPRGTNGVSELTPGDRNQPGSSEPETCVDAAGSVRRQRVDLIGPMSGPPTQRGWRFVKPPSRRSRQWPTARRYTNSSLEGFFTCERILRFPSSLPALRTKSCPSMRPRRNARLLSGTSISKVVPSRT